MYRIEILRRCSLYAIWSANVRKMVSHVLLMILQEIFFHRTVSGLPSFSNELYRTSDWSTIMLPSYLRALKQTKQLVFTFFRKGVVFIYNVNKSNMIKKIEPLTLQLLII